MVFDSSASIQQVRALTDLLGLYYRRARRAGASLTTDATADATCEEVCGGTLWGICLRCALLPSRQVLKFLLRDFHVRKMEKKFDCVIKTVIFAFVMLCYNPAG